MASVKRYSKEQALQKAKHYCAYRERCHKEVREKLYSYALWKNEVEEVLVKLIEENYLNEERFAHEFALGKFQLKHWGKEKIKHELKQREVSVYCINSALKALDEAAYLQTFEKLANEKLQVLKSERNIFIKKRKLQNYLLQKGYGREIVAKYLRAI